MNDKCSNGFCEFDSHTTTNKLKYRNMKVKFLKNAKIWIVQLVNSQQIVFSHSSKSECYEYIFKTVHYA